MEYVLMSTTPPPLEPPPRRVISVFGLVVVGVTRQNHNQQGGGEGDGGGRWQNDMYDGQPQQQARHCSRCQKRCGRRMKRFPRKCRTPTDAYVGLARAAVNDCTVL